MNERGRLMETFMVINSPLEYMKLFITRSVDLGILSNQAMIFCRDIAFCVL